MSTGDAERGIVAVSSDARVSAAHNTGALRRKAASQPAVGGPRGRPAIHVRTMEGEGGTREKGVAKEELTQEV